MDTLARDRQVIDQALDANPAAENVQVNLVLPRRIAEAVRELLQLHLSEGDAMVVPVGHFFTPNEAAALLGVSRPTVYKYMDDDRLEFVRVGKHRRIPALALARFPNEEKTRRRNALDELANFSNEHGLVD